MTNWKGAIPCIARGWKSGEPKRRERGARFVPVGAEVRQRASGQEQPRGYSWPSATPSMHIPEE